MVGAQRCHQSESYADATNDGRARQMVQRLRLCAIASLVKHHRNLQLSSKENYQYEPKEPPRMT